MANTFQYRGYEISFDRNRPVTGRWRGVRFGVGLCAGTEAQLLRMIDVRIAEAQARMQGPSAASAAYGN